MNKALLYSVSSVKQHRQFPAYWERCSSVGESEEEAGMSDLRSGKPDLGGEGEEHWSCLGWRRSVSEQTKFMKAVRKRVKE